MLIVSTPAALPQAIAFRPFGASANFPNSSLLRKRLKRAESTSLTHASLSNIFPAQNIQPSPELTAMANPKHLEILNQGVKAWNEWRRKHRDIHPDLSGANLSGTNLSNASLRYTNL